MLANSRRKLGLGTSAPTPIPGQGQNPDLSNLVSANSSGGMTESLFGEGINLSGEDLGFNWPTDIAGTFGGGPLSFYILI